ncbi:MAG: PIN domain-containing protein [Gemmatimonadales bacterium]|jgi:predicted nucleic acid-binding protein|nr:PIN domain-containing protein [Gemmatimonadales bacterium]
MTSSPVIADTGFWVALTNRSDTHHARAVEVLEGLERRLVTTWPVLTETCHILLRRGGSAAQRRFLESWLKGSFDVHDLNPEQAARIHALMLRYESLPMDLADASLVLLAEALGCGDILSTDRRDFETYRWKQRTPFRNLLLSD